MAQQAYFLTLSKSRSSERSFPIVPFLKSLEEVIRNAAELQKENSGIELLPDLTADAIKEFLDRFIRSLKTPSQQQQVKGALEDKRFLEFPTVQWSIVLNMQRKFLRDASLALIARKLELLQTETPEIRNPRTVNKPSRFVTKTAASLLRAAFRFPSRVRGTSASSQATRCLATLARF